MSNSLDSDLSEVTTPRSREFVNDDGREDPEDKSDLLVIGSEELASAPPADPGDFDII